MTLARRLVLPMSTLALLAFGGGRLGAQDAAPRPRPPAEPVEAAVPTTHPSDVIANVSGLGPATSRAIARVIRTMNNAIPNVEDVALEDRPSGVVEARIVYSYSLNEACVRNQNAEGRAAVRAAREACRGTRGLGYELVNVRCMPRPRSDDGCASVDVLWAVSLVDTASSGQTRDRTTIDEIRFAAVDVDGDPALESVVDYELEKYSYDPSETRSGGDVWEGAHELVVVDQDGAVLLRDTLSESIQDTPSTSGANIVVRVSETSARVSTAACGAEDAACDRHWRTVALTREAPAVPAMPAAPDVRAAVD